jgi:hypothetical protein
MNLRGPHRTINNSLTTQWLETVLKVLHKPFQNKWLDKQHKTFRELEQAN